MKRILLIVLFALATSSPALAQGKAADGKVAQELEKFRLETIAAFQNNDVAALDRLLADDLIGTNSAGATYDKASLIGLIKSGQIKWESVEIEAGKNAVHGNGFVGSSIVKSRLKANGQCVSEVNRTTVVAEKRQGRWQYTAIHTSHLQPSAKQVEQEIKQALEEIRQAILKGDAAALDRLVADNWMFTSADGAVVGQAKKEIGGAIKTGTLKYDSWSFDDTVIRPLAGNIALINQTATFKGRYGTQAIEDRVRATSVMARSPQGHWSLVSTQQTRIAQPKQ